MLHDQADARTLGTLRFVVFILAAWSRVLRPAWEAWDIPDYSAVGVMHLVGAEFWMPHAPFALGVAIHVLTIGLCVAVALGIGPYRRLAPMACIALTLSHGLLSGNTGIPSKSVLIILMSFVLCLFPAADALTLTRQRRRAPADPSVYRAAMISATLVLMITYVFVAARRIAAGGLDIYLDDTVLHAVATRASEWGGEGEIGIRACESVGVAWSLRIGFPVVTLVEFLSPLCLLFRRFRWVWLVVILSFHLGVLITMGIFFRFNVFLIPFLVVGLDPFRRGAEPSGPH